jgi:hypothetical protein
MCVCVCGHERMGVYVCAAVKVSLSTKIWNKYVDKFGELIQYHWFLKVSVLFFGSRLEFVSWTFFLFLCWQFIPFQVTKALKFNTILGNKEHEGSSYVRKRRPTLIHENDSIIPDDIPTLERDDPRIERAIAEGEMENYEVKETTGIQKLHLHVSLASVLKKWEPEFHVPKHKKKWKWSFTKTKN